VLEDVLICKLVRLLEALPICARISSRKLASMVSAFANLPLDAILHSLQIGI
jgi:hypothetical protein